MLTWIRGRKIMIERYSKQTLDYVHLLNNLQTHPILRVPGTAVFLTPQAVGVPPTLLHHIKHNKALHEQVVVMSVQATSIPFVDPEDQVTVTDLGDNFWAVSARHGFCNLQMSRECSESLGNKDSRQTKVQRLTTLAERSSRHADDRRCRAFRSAFSARLHKLVRTIHFISPFLQVAWLSWEYKSTSETLCSGE